MDFFFIGEKNGVLVLVQEHSVEYPRFRESGRNLWFLMHWIELKVLSGEDLVLF